MQKNKLFLFGAHISIADGLEKSFSRGESIGCTAIQIFTKSNRQWNAKQITDDDAKIFKESFEKSSIKSVVVHASYLINLGSAEKSINIKSCNSMIEELERCQKLELPYLVLHPGSSKKTNEKETLKIISDNLDFIFESLPGKSMILLENMSGMGNSVAYKFEQLAKIIQNSKHKNRLGICFDTCHAFAAGYDFTSEKKYINFWDYIDKLIGIKLIKAMHINGSKKEINSKIDRHSHISEGFINIEAFRLLFNDERFFEIPKILETPLETGINDYKKEMKTIINLISEKNLKYIKGSNLEIYL